MINKEVYRRDPDATEKQSQHSGKTKIILALDVDSFSKAKYFVNKLYPKIKIFKIGPQLFISCGPQIIEFINRKGAGAFLDLKLFDIPNTAAGALQAAVRLKVKMFTLHILGGKNMLKRAVRVVKQESRRLKIKPPLLLGVTVLTSQKAKPATVLKLAKVGLNCGLDGIVCSAREAALLRKEIKKKLVIVTPGIRPHRKTADDQKRIATVKQAQAAGSDFLVIGRPILEAEDPVKAIKRLNSS